MGRTYIYRINYCIHWTKIGVQKLKSFHWTRKSLWVSIERESNKGKEFDIDMKSNHLRVIWNNFKIDRLPYCTCVLLRDHFFILKQQLALDFLIPNCTRKVQSTNTNLYNDGSFPTLKVEWTSLPDYRNKRNLTAIGLSAIRTS